MKILFLIHNIAYCGAERVLALVANELCKRGHDIYIITDPLEINYPLDTNIHILDAYLYSKKHDASSVIGKALRLVKYNLGFYKTLKHYINEINPDHIVSFMGFFIWQLLPFRHRYKITISDHSAMNRSIGIIRDYERHQLAGKFYYQTVLTQYDKDYLGSKRRNVVVVSNPLTFTPMTDEEYEKNFENRKNILFCGSIDRYEIKGLDNLLRAFAIAKRKCPDLVLDIVGNGSDANVAKMKQLATDLKISDSVYFLGFKKDVGEEMKKHSMLVLPSRSEGFGMVIIEAMASGCAVISYALSGPKEIINNGVDGVLIENQDIDKLAYAICDLACSTSKRKMLGLNGIHSVKRFSLDNIVDKWLNILKQ